MAATIEFRYLSYIQSEVYCSVSRWTLYRAVKRGALKPCRAGATIRFDRLELDAWMRRGEASAPDGAVEQ